MASTLWADIQAANEKFMDAFKTGDATKVAALYTEDCKTMPTGADVQIGRAGVAAVFGSPMSAGAKSVKLTIDEVGPMGAGDMAYERSHYEFFKEDGSVMDKGKYVVIWKKVDGTWYLYIDIFNTDIAPSV